MYCINKFRKYFISVLYIYIIYINLSYKKRSVTVIKLSLFIYKEATDISYFNIIYIYKKENRIDKSGKYDELKLLFY